MCVCVCVCVSCDDSKVNLDLEAKSRINFDNYVYYSEVHFSHAVSVVYVTHGIIEFLCILI